MTNPAMSNYNSDLHVVCVENDWSNNVIVWNGLCMGEGGGRVNRELDIDSIFCLELGDYWWTYLQVPWCCERVFSRRTYLQRDQTEPQNDLFYYSMPLPNISEATNDWIYFGGQSTMQFIHSFYHFVWVIKCSPYIKSMHMHLHNICAQLYEGLPALGSLST